MPWSYKHNPKLQIIEAAYTGNTTAQDLQESTSEFITLEKENGINRFLVDTSEMVLSASLADLYNLPDKQYLEEEADRTGCVALILPTAIKEKEAALFFETACKNRGWKVQTFSEYQEAVNWLISGPSVNAPGKGDAS